MFGGVRCFCLSFVDFSSECLDDFALAVVESPDGFAVVLEFVEDFHDVRAGHDLFYLGAERYYLV